jgi:ElaA protein
MTVHDALLVELDPTTLYAILRLRSEVFVIEQECLYRDADGRDLEPEARHVWISDEDSSGDDAIRAYLRVLRDPDGSARVGRVVTAPQDRGAGLAGELMLRALELSAGRDVVLEAQSYLVSWYARFGFEATGPEYLEDGIAHTPMRRPAQ